jgi:hypothetical protein
LQFELQQGLVRWIPARSGALAPQCTSRPAVDQRPARVASSYAALKAQFGAAFARWLFSAFLFRLAVLWGAHRARPL